MSYRVLVLPDHGVLSIKALRKVAELARAGATVIGYRTQETASLVEDPETEEEGTRLAQELWGNAPVRHDAGEGGRGSRKVGRGLVAWGFTAREWLLEKGVPRDGLFHTESSEITTGAAAIIPD